MIHGFFVDGGKVSYRNRYVRTPKWDLENAAGKALFGGFDPRASDPSVAGKDGGVANTNIVWHAGQLLALEEGPAGDSTRTRLIPWATPTTTAAGSPPTPRSIRRPAKWSGSPTPWATFRSRTPCPTELPQAGKVVRRDDFEAPFSSMVHDFLVTDPTCCSPSCRSPAACRGPWPAGRPSPGSPKREATSA